MENIRLGLKLWGGGVPVAPPPPPPGARDRLGNPPPERGGSPPGALCSGGCPAATPPPALRSSAHKVINTFFKNYFLNILFSLLLRRKAQENPLILTILAKAAGHLWIFLHRAFRGAELLVKDARFCIVSFAE